MDVLDQLENIQLLQRLIESDYITMIQYVCSDSEKLSVIAMEHCKKFVYSYPSLYFSKKVLKTLIEVISFVQNNLQSKFSVQQSTLQTTHFCQQVSVPSTKKQLRSILQFLLKNFTDLYFNAYIFDDFTQTQITNIFLEASTEEKNYYTYGVILFLKQNHPSEKLLQEYRFSIKLWLRSKKKMFLAFREFKHKFKNIWSVRKQLNSPDFIQNSFKNQIFEQQQNIHQMIEHNQNFQLKQNVRYCFKLGFSLKVIKYLLRNYSLDFSQLEFLKPYLEPSDYDLFQKSLRENSKEGLRTRNQAIKSQLKRFLGYLINNFSSNKQFQKTCQPYIIKFLIVFRENFAMKFILGQLSRILLTKNSTASENMIEGIKHLIDTIKQKAYYDCKFENEKKHSLLKLEKFRYSYKTSVFLTNRLQSLAKSGESNQRVLIHLITLFETHSLRNKNRCLIQLVKFLKKNLSYLYLKIADFPILEQLVFSLLIFEDDVIRKQSLDLFIEINFLFLNYLDLKMNHLDKNDEIRDHFQIKRLITQHAIYCCSYWATNDHMIKNGQTDFSLNDLKDHNKFIQDLHKISTRLKSPIFKEFLKESVSLTENQNNFFSRVKMRILTLGSSVFSTNHQVSLLPPESQVSLQSVYKAINYFISKKVILLKALIFYEKDKGPSTQVIKFEVQEAEDIYQELIRINPITANNFFKK